VGPTTEDDAPSATDRDDFAGVSSPFRELPAVVRWLADEGASFVLTRTFLLRLLGLVYFVVFVSTLLQGPALIGDHGLLPMRGYLHFVARASGGTLSAFANAPTLFWISPSDVSLIALSILGAMLSLAVMLGVTNAGVMIALWILQTSIHSVGQTFWGFGWEIQLLETGMIAAFMCPMTIRGGKWRPFATAPPLATIWLMRWLVIRIMLGAGLIKLRGDPCWRELTCLVTHYETQPNPSPLSWVFHQMPPWAHTIGVLFNHFVEIVCPAFVLGPRWMRRAAGGFFVAFQAILIASGNLSFLNWLTIVPALACFDDALLLRVLPSRFRQRLGPSTEKATTSAWHRRLALGYAAVVGVLSVGPVLNLVSSRQAMNASFDPLHLVNTYGAFGTVSRVRDEIVIEGTDADFSEAPDSEWKAYELPCKPGDPMRRPCLISPYHERLDWQMWFAAMSTVEEEPWMATLVSKLLEGDAAIFPLLATNPFPDPRHPPRFVRARLYRYEFTRPGEPGWWRRRLLGPGDRPGGSEYFRVLGKDDPDLVDFIQAHRFQ